MPRPTAAVRVVIAMVVILLASVRADAAERPKLVLFITVDQLRGDMLPRYRDRFGEGGFRRLLEGGVYYADAHYRHATTFTACGHATLFTGGNPPEHGIAANNWIDPETAERVYCVEDDRHVIIGNEPKDHLGTSPRNLTSSTLGDELVIATAGRSRVFSVSIKDRGAILPGGHLGKAFWYSADIGGFVTSTYYYDEYPWWVRAWNESRLIEEYRDTEWKLLRDRSEYVFGDQDDRSCESGYGSLGRVFPHPMRDDTTASLYKTLIYTPFGDELTLDFAINLLKEEKLGQQEATDLLAVSFSVTDYIGHAFGPNSLEYEDNLLRLDRAIARLLAAVDKTVGRDNVVTVLTADHGIDGAPEHLYTLVGGDDADECHRLTALEDGRKVLDLDEGSCGACCELAGRIGAEQLLSEARSVLEEMGAGSDAVSGFWNPGVFLSSAALRRDGVDLAEAERRIASRLQQLPGVSLSMARSDLLAGRIPAGPMAERVARSVHGRRSANVFIVQEPSWHLYHDATRYAAMHGSPYSYDTYVPIIVAGPGVEARAVHRRVAPSDIAPTLALMLGIEAPTGCVGLPMVEVFGE